MDEYGPGTPGSTVRRSVNQAWSKDAAATKSGASFAIFRASELEYRWSRNSLGEVPVSVLTSQRRMASVHDSPIPSKLSMPVSSGLGRQWVTEPERVLPAARKPTAEPRASERAA